MRVLLDSNVLVKWLSDTPLPRRVERMMAKQSTVAFVSIVTGWEIVMKPRLGLSSDEIEAALAALGASVLPLKFRHLDEYSKLPILEDHRDPFDRMLIAQALSEDLEIVTGDTRFGGYKGLRVFWD